MLRRRGLNKVSLQPRLSVSMGSLSFSLDGDDLRTTYVRVRVVLFVALALSMLNINFLLLSQS